MAPAEVHAVGAVGVGRPYVYGGGAVGHVYPSGTVGVGGHGVGYDCEGLVRAMGVALGLYGYTAPDRRAADALSWESCGDEPGAVIVYAKGAHVTISAGDGWAYGANGGDSKTDGNDPAACVKKYEVSSYWRSAFEGYRRFPPLGQVDALFAERIFNRYRQARMAGMDAAAAQRHVAETNGLPTFLADGLGRLVGW